MSFHINVASINIQHVTEYLADIRKDQLPFATSLAMNRTALNIKEGLRDKMPRIFDNPVNFTLNSLYTVLTKKDNPRAEVGFKDWAPKGTPAGKYLHAQVFGGARNSKKSEMMLKQKGILSLNEYIVPTGSFQDSYGNVVKGSIQKMLASLQAGREAGFTSNSKRNSERSGQYGQFFITDSISGNKTIYKRVGKGHKSKTKKGGVNGGKTLPHGFIPFMHIITTPKYNIRFDFEKEAHTIFDKTYVFNFQEAIRVALSSARNN